MSPRALDQFQHLAHAGAEALLAALQLFEQLDAARQTAALHAEVSQALLCLFGLAAQLVALVFLRAELGSGVYPNYKVIVRPRNMRVEDVVPNSTNKTVLDFLKILPDAWPPILAAEGALDPAERRNLLLRRQAAQWRQLENDARDARVPQIWLEP